MSPRPSSCTTSTVRPVRSGRRESGGSRLSGGNMPCPGPARLPVRVLPRLGKSPGVQSRHGPVHPDPPIARRTCQRLVVRLQRRVELPLDLQHHGEIRPEHRLRRVESDRLAEPARPPRQIARPRPVPSPSGHVPRHCRDAPTGAVPARRPTPRRRRGRAGIRPGRSAAAHRPGSAPGTRDTVARRATPCPARSASAQDRCTDERSSRAHARRGSGSARPRPPCRARRPRDRAAAAPRCPRRSRSSSWRQMRSACRF